MQSIKAKKGDVISLQGKDYRLDKSVNLRVSPEHRTDLTIVPQKKADPPIAPPEIIGEPKSDPVQGINKAAVLDLIQEKIDALEKHENKLLMDGLFNDKDDLDFIDQERGEHYKTANYAATTVHIMDLKSLFNKVKNLS